MRETGRQTRENRGARSLTNNGLTYAERQSLSLVANGASVRDIAVQLKTCPEAVCRHLSAARDKLDANTVLEAVAKAIKAGLLSLH